VRSIIEYCRFVWPYQSGIQIRTKSKGNQKTKQVVKTINNRVEYWKRSDKNNSFPANKEVPGKTIVVNRFKKDKKYNIGACKVKPDIDNISRVW